MKAVLTWPGHAWLSLPARAYLAWVFLAACLHKLLDPGSFALDIATYDILPLWLINPLAIVLPWLELAAGLLLIVGFRTRAAAMAICGMMVMFLVALVWALAKGLDMSCGCFASRSAGEDLIGLKTVFRDLAWLALAAYVLLFDRNPLGLDRLAWRGRKSDD